jgi:hypothetical protein
MRTAVAAVTIALIAAAPSWAGANSGDLLRLFDDARVRIVTTEDATIADRLLADTRPRERENVPVDSYLKTPATTGALCVFLINRQRLPVYRHVPETCPADGQDLWIETLRQGKKTSGLVISAPDIANLRLAIEQVRTWRELPRTPRRQAVRSIALIPIGEAPRALPRGTHLVPADTYARLAPRLTGADEVILLDRGSGARVPDPFAGSLIGKSFAPTDTVAWREIKASGSARIFVSGPNAAPVEAVLPSLLAGAELTETPTVLRTARDLRTIRRVAVSGVASSETQRLVARQIASRTAGELRGAETFEVLERAGLSEVLSEIALSQAGITRRADRSRVQKLAAADALLVIELTDLSGRADYTATHERQTSRLGPPPRRPLEPTRLKVDLSLPGKEDDPVSRGVLEAVLSKVVGTRSDDDLREALTVYQRRTVPLWQQQVRDYNEARRNRPISWRQNVTLHGSAHLRGSVRLVDLADGLVLWETPLDIADRCETPFATATVTTYGEDSSPDNGDIPSASPTVPEPLLGSVADAAALQAVTALRTTALLPGAGTTAGVAPTGKLLDSDGDTLLIGLGMEDGIVVGDTLRLRLSTGETVRLVVTRARRRTCDAAFEMSVPASVRTQVARAEGLTAEKER